MDYGTKMVDNEDGNMSLVLYFAPCSEVPDDTILTKCSTIVDHTYEMTFCQPSAVALNLPFPMTSTVGPHNKHHVHV